MTLHCTSFLQNSIPETLRKIFLPNLGVQGVKLCLSYELGIDVSC